MYFCLRIDLDYVPWDSPDAAEFGHAEPAMLMRLLELARFKGYKYHFFASNRVLRAFPTEAEAVLNDGHDLDWFCKHPDQPDTRIDAALSLFEMLGHKPTGMAIKGIYPEDVAWPSESGFRFLSAQLGFNPSHCQLFPVETRPLREGLRTGFSPRAWCDATKTHIRDAASRNHGVTVVVRPQVLGKHDPKLTFTKEVLELANIAGLRMSTLRGLASPSS